jgi:hypothetical protein
MNMRFLHDRRLYVRENLVVQEWTARATYIKLLSGERSWPSRRASTSNERAST